MNVGHEDRVWCVAWNPVRPLIASCSADKTVRISHYQRTKTDNDNDDETNKDSSSSLKFTTQTSVPTGHTKTVRCVTWAPSGQTFATASFDANIAVWEQEGGARDEFGGDNDAERGEWECASLLEGHETECKCIAYSSTGTLLASCSRDKTVWVWEGVFEVLKISFVSKLIRLFAVQPDSDFECMGVLMTHTQDVKCVAWHPTEEVTSPPFSSQLLPN